MSIQQIFGEYLGKVTLPLPYCFHSMLQAKIILILLKDDDSTFYAEMPLENWHLQSDINKLPEILVRKSGW